MWAFIPASANWIGARGSLRCSISGLHATGQGAPVWIVASASKYMPANTTSRRSRNCGLWNVVPALAFRTASVTWR